MAFRLHREHGVCVLAFACVQARVLQLVAAAMLAIAKSGTEGARAVAASGALPRLLASTGPEPGVRS